MSGFQHDIAGGSGNLIVTSVQSPNFVHGVSGWKIAKDGSAEFQNIVLPAGSAGAVVTFAAVAPSSPHVGDLWYNTANGLEVSQWNGTTWVPYQIGTGAIASGAITQPLLDGAITARSLGGVTTTISGTAPASPVTGDIWIDSANGYQLQRYNGTSWVAISWTATDVITSGSITTTLLNSSVTARALGGITTTIAGSAPGSPATGDIWINSSNGYQINQYNGTSFVAVQWTATDVISAGTIDATLITAATITGSLIAAGTITAGNIAANTITATQIAANTITGSLIAASTITGSNIAAGTITASNIQANTITASQLAAGIVYAGIVDSTTVNAATFTGSTFKGTDFILNASGLFFYSGTPASGNLILSVVPGTVSVNDPFGNSAPPGFAAGSSANAQIQMVSSGGIGQLQFQSDNTNHYSNGFLECGIIGGNASQVNLSGPSKNAVSHADHLFIELNSSDGTGSANIGFIYDDSNGVTSQPAYVDWSGFNIQMGSIVAVAPGTGTSATNAAAQETWHTMAAFSTGYSHGTPVPAYKLMPDRTVSFTGQVSVVFGTAGGNFVTLPSAYWPQSQKVVAVPIGSGTPATSGTARVTVNTNGTVSFNSVPSGSGSYTFWLDNIRYPLDY